MTSARRSKPARIWPTRSCYGAATSRRKWSARSSTVWNDGGPWSRNWCTGDARRSADDRRGRADVVALMAGVPPRDVAHEVRRSDARTAGVAVGRALDDVVARPRPPHDGG